MKRFSMSQGVFVNAVLRGLGYKVARVLWAFCQLATAAFLCLVALSLWGHFLHGHFHR